MGGTTKSSRSKIDFLLTIDFTYLVVLVVFIIEAGRRYMMSVVPVLIDQASIIGVVLRNLLLRQPEARLVLEVTISHIDELIDMLAAQRRLSMKSRNGRSHLSENHDIILRHFL